MTHRAPTVLVKHQEHVMMGDSTVRSRDDNSVTDHNRNMKGSWRKTSNGRDLCQEKAEDTEDLYKPGRNQETSEKLGKMAQLAYVSVSVCIKSL